MLIMVSLAFKCILFAINLGIFGHAFTEVNQQCFFFHVKDTSNLPDILYDWIDELSVQHASL